MCVVLMCCFLFLSHKVVFLVVLMFVRFSTCLVSFLISFHNAFEYLLIDFF